MKKDVKTLLKDNTMLIVLVLVFVFLRHADVHADRRKH